eukprot:354680-Amphidinium_carterae.3
MTRSSLIQVVAEKQTGSQDDGQGWVKECSCDAARMTLADAQPWLQWLILRTVHHNPGYRT